MNKPKTLIYATLAFASALCAPLSSEAATHNPPPPAPAHASASHFTGTRAGNWNHGGNYTGNYRGHYRHYRGGYSSFYYGTGFGFGYPYAFGGYPYGYGYGYPYGYGYGDPYGYDQPVVRGEMIGSRRSLGAEVQQRLAREGYYRGAIDGVVGNGTRRAIRAYERAHGLPVDGEIDRQLLRTLGLV